MGINQTRFGLPKYVSRQPDAHGNVRLYYRRNGRKVRLNAEMGTPEFAAELERATNYLPPEPAARKKQAVRQHHPESVVYFILYGNRKRVKIGTSRQPGVRFKTIRTALPVKATLFYATPGDHQLESYLHKLFAADRIGGEWFHYTKPIQEWIAADERRRHNERGMNALGVSPRHLVSRRKFSVEKTDA